MDNSLYLHLNSEYADFNNDNIYGFNIGLIEGNLQDTIYLSIEHLVLPYTWYNINSYNNTLNYRIGSTPYTLTIQTGNYNIIELMQYLNSNLPNFTVTYNKNKNKYNFVHASSDFTFLSTSSCLKLLGFKKNTQVTSTSRTLTSTQAVNLIYTPCVCIYSNLENSSINISSSRQCRRLLFSIPIDLQPNDLLTYMNREMKINLNTNNLSYLEFSMCDIEGKPLDLNGVPFSLTIKLEFVDFVN